ncbi:DUF11 domain-containing protein [Actinoplanes sp. L3-i22]|uniref:DUF7507 domain-containing protein n=1 Tax=Actinoplanes sp. L3-i22 TaxID=2836373 RepID=UPI001C795FBB|nr:DUF11 domain-containing protein [Actinoplanes sp. L3-i22]BCY12193.1 hypothetical protein L3i22_072810 [Actinoplanes sp. L3-i22]
MTRRRCAPHLIALFLLAVCFLVAPALRERPARAAPTTCTTPVTLINGDYELPVIAANSMSLINEGADMPGWRTTAPDHVFELWHEVRQGFNAGSGVQFVELNANYVSTLYQDVPTPAAGQVLRWELKHRGRLGTDVMAVKIGPAGGTLVQQGAQISDGSAAWGTTSGVYTVPGGQTSTRFAFESISAAQNKPTYGNFLDGISFGTAACLFTTTSVSAATANVGDLLTYTVNAENKGGNPAKAAVLSDTLPAGTTFVPGSIRSITGSSSTAVSDSADSDTGEYDAATRTVRVRAGTGAGSAAGGTIPVGESRSITYQVRVNTAAAEATLSTDGAATFTEPIANSTVTSTGNTVGTTVNRAADLQISAAIAAGGVVAGRSATTNLTVTNAGPSTASAVSVSATVPLGIVNVTASMTGASCSVTGQNARCDLPSMGSGATGLMVVSGDVLPAATPGAQATLTSSVTSTTYEVNQADNAASVSGAVATLADVGVTMTNTAGVAGAPITYTVTVTNAGPSVARTLVLGDVIPPTATYNSATGGTCAPTAIGTLECQLADMAPGATTVVTIDMTLKSNAAGAVNNAVSVTSSTPDPNAANNNFSVQSAGTAVADVGVKLGLSQLSAYAGDTVVYTLTVTNNGPSDATNVTFNTIVPPGVTIVRNPPYCTPNACTVGTLPAGATLKLSGNATLQPTAVAGPGFASTTVISPTTDNNAANDTDTINFTVLLKGDLAVGQTLDNPADPGNLVAGQTVTGVVTVTNSGPTRAEGVVMRQSIAAGWPVPSVTTSGATCTFQGTVTAGVTPDGGTFVCNRPTLATAATWQVTFGAVQLAPGYGSAAYARTATVSASTPDPDSSNDSVTTTAAVQQRADVEVAKAVIGSSSLVQTEEVRYRVTVINHGPSDATDVVLREIPDAGLSLASGTTADGTYDGNMLSWTIQRLTPSAGPGVTLDLVGTVLGTGTLHNDSQIVSADGTDPVGGNNSASATITAVAAAPGLSVRTTSTYSTPPPLGVGATISYTYEVTNTGNLPMTTITLAGDLSGPATCVPATLAVGATATCTAGTHTVSPAEVGANRPLTDTVTAQALNTATVLPATYAQFSSSVSVAVPVPSLSVVLTPTVSAPSRQNAAAVGDTIAYSYAVTNNGNVPMDNIALTDTRGDTITCPPGPLATGQSITCTHGNPGYTLVQADLDNGVPVTNVATVTAIESGTTTGFSFASPSSGIPVAAAAPGLTFTTTPSTAGPVGAGATITYTYTVRNTGNVTVDTIVVTDSNAAGVSCPHTVLAPTDPAMTCASTGTPYAVGQTDVDAGTPVYNDAIVDARSVAPGHLPVGAEVSEGVPVVPTVTALTVVSTPHVSPAGPAAGVRPGDQVYLGYVVRNTGNVTMRAIAVTDTLTGPATCPNVPLAPSATMSCTGGPSYPVSQDDFDAGAALTATARVAGRAPLAASAIGYGTSTVTVPIGSGSALLTIATAAVRVSPAGHRTAVEAGDRVGFDFTITNPGTLSVRGISVTDSRTGAVTCPATVLLPGATMTCATDDFSVAQSDIDAAVPLTGVATLRGRSGTGGGPLTTFGTVSTWVPVVVGAPSLGTQAIGTVTPAAHQSGAGAGDTVTWTFLVVNNGNQTMTGISAGPGTITCPQTRLGVREAMTCTDADVHTVTQDEVDLGAPIGTEIAVTGSAPDGPHTFGPFDGSVPVLAAAPVLEIALTTRISETAAASLTAAGVEVGDLLRYGYKVTNRGNVTVAELTVSHARAPRVTCDATRLAPGAGTDCAAADPYRVTQADVDAATPIVDRAVARGLVPGANRKVTSNTAGTSVPLAPPSPELNGAQTAVWTDTDGDGRLGPGDDVVSTIVITNTGNVTLVNLRVTGLPAGVTCAVRQIAPGAQVICRSGTYHLTSRQIAVGQHTFEAHIAGDLLDPAADDVTAEAPSTVAVPARRPARPPARPGSPGRPGGTSPITGQSTALVILLGMALLITGGGLLLVSRHLPRRTRRRPALHARR